VLLSCGFYGNVIRFLAPLTIPDALLKEGFHLLEAALNEVTHGAAPAPVKDAATQNVAAG
jgi:acetylornithine/succinyldiaminopimelate/putrescine aminotransferase